MSIPFDPVILQEQYLRLCQETPASCGLRSLTTPDASPYLAALDDFEQTGDLAALQTKVRPNWPFATRGPKAASYTPLAKRDKDLDLSAVYHALTLSADLMQPGRLNAMVLYNLLIRRGIAPDINARKLHLFVHANLDAVLTGMNVRWFVSYCDSIADASMFPEAYRARAGLAASTLNALRFVASPYAVLDGVGIDLGVLIDRVDDRRRPLGAGTVTFWQGGGDGVMNQIERTMRVLGCSDVVGLGLRLAVDRLLLRNDASPQLHRLSTWSTNPINGIKLKSVKAMIGAAHNIRDAPSEHLIYVPTSESGPKTSLDTTLTQLRQPKAERQLTTPEDLPARHAPDAGNPTYLVLNDTHRLSSGFHIGTTAVMATISRQMAGRGLHNLGSINGPKDFETFLQRGLWPDVVVLNGEGTMHHDGHRARELLALAQRFSERGSKCVLINSVWEENGPDMAAALACFKRVFVRDHPSHVEISKARPDAEICPDLSIDSFLRMERYPHHLPTHDLGIIDSVLDDVAAKLWKHASRGEHPFLFMGPRNYPVFSRAAGAGAAAHLPWPATIERLTDCRRVVSGRFHGAIASLCLGLPTLITASNTLKNQALSAQINPQIFIETAPLLISSPNGFASLIADRFAVWDDPAVLKKRDLFLSGAVAQIDRAFQAIAALP